MNRTATTSLSPVRFSAAGQRIQAPTIARLMAMALENPALLSLAAGFTDNATLPLEAVRDATAQLAGEPAAKESLQYGSNAGRVGLRQTLLDRLCAQEKPLADLGLDRVFITNGSQQALFLAAQVLCNPGDIVLVDQPTYFVFLEMLAGLGVDAVPLPVNVHGQLDPAGVADLLRRLRAEGRAERIRAVYFVSYYSNPSGRTLSQAEKESLAEVLLKEEVRVPILEDAAYRELYYEQAPEAPSILALPGFADFPCLYLSTLTKPYATGLKVGYGICNDAEWWSRMLYLKGHQDFGTANFNQAIYERVFATGGFDAHLTQLRPHYQGKGRLLSAALREQGLAELGWSWSEPEGGLYLWLTAPEQLDTGLSSEFCRDCIRAGVLYVPGELCFPEPAPRHYVRLSFGVLGAADLREAAARFVGVARASSGVNR